MNPLSVIRSLALLFLIIILPSACSDRESHSEEETILKHVVIEYTRLLSEGYITLNMSGLLAVATEERAQKAYYHMAALGEGRIKMDARRRDISFPAVERISEDRAEVKTVEKWTYDHINIDTEEIESASRATYELTYHLMKNEGTWRVSEITVNREETENIKE